MEEKKESFKQKWIASRAAFENILFEKNLSKKEEGKNYKGLLGLILIFVFQFILLYLRYKSSGSILSYEDLQKFQIVKDLSTSFSKGFFSFIFGGKLLEMNFDLPFYYLSFLPVTKFITTDPFNALIIVNSFYYLIFLFSIYFSVNIRGNYKGALMAVLIASSFPFVFDSFLHFSLYFASSSLVSLTYLFFIKSEDMENPKWIFPMALSFSLGLITDKMFIFYTLPLLHWFNWGFAGIYRDKILKAFLIFIIIGIPFYIRIILKFLFFYIFQGKEIFQHYNFNLFWYFYKALNPCYFIFFIIGILAIIWMKYSLFDLYEKRKIIFNWFFISYIAISIIPVKNVHYIYPLLAPLAISSGIMIPDLVRKYFFYFIFLISFLNQVPFIDKFSINFKNEKIDILGYYSPLKESKIKETFAIIKENLKNPKSVISIYGKDNYINAETLSYLKNKDNFLKDVNFVNYPFSMLTFSDMVIIVGKENNDRFKKNIYNYFENKISFNEGNIFIYVKNIPEDIILKDQSEYFFKTLKIGEITLKDATFFLKDYDSEKKFYKKAEIYLPYFNYDEFDIYNLRVEFSNLCLIKEDNNGFICGFSSIKIKSLKTTDFSLARFMEKKLINLKDFSIKADNIKNLNFFTLTGLYNKKRIVIDFNLENKKDGIRIKILTMEYDGFSLPGIFYYFLNFDILKTDLPFSLEFKKIKVNNSLIEIS